MSHIAVYTTTVGEVNIDLLKKALEVFSLEENSPKTRDYIEDYYGEKHTVWNGDNIIKAFFSRELSKGVGVAVNKQGHLTFVSHDSGPALEKVKAGIERAYKLVALVTALQEMGYDIEVLQETGEITSIEATLARTKIMASIDNKGNIVTDFDGFSGKSCYEEAVKLTEALKKLGVNVNVQNLERKEELARDLKEMGKDPNIAYGDWCG